MNSLCVEYRPRVTGRFTGAAGIVAAHLRDGGLFVGWNGRNAPPPSGTNSQPSSASTLVTTQGLERSRNDRGLETWPLLLFREIIESRFLEIEYDWIYSKNWNSYSTPSEKYLKWMNSNVIYRNIPEICFSNPPLEFYNVQ